MYVLLSICSSVLIHSSRSGMVTSNYTIMNARTDLQHGYPKRISRVTCSQC